MKKNKLSFEEMEQVLTKVVENGMKEIHLEERVEYLKRQKEKLIETKNVIKLLETNYKGNLLYEREYKKTIRY